MVFQKGDYCACVRTYMLCNSTLLRDHPLGPVKGGLLEELVSDEENLVWDMYVFVTSKGSLAKQWFLKRDTVKPKTTVGCSMGHLSDTNAPLYKVHLSTKTTITWSLAGLL